MSQEMLAGTIIFLVGLALLMNPNLAIKRNGELRNNAIFMVLMRIVGGAFAGAGILLIRGVIH